LVDKSCAAEGLWLTFTFKHILIKIFKSYEYLSDIYVYLPETIFLKRVGKSFALKGGRKVAN
jgi:hypothetical protein